MSATPRTDVAVKKNMAAVCELCFELERKVDEYERLLLAIRDSTHKSAIVLRGMVDAALSRGEL